MTFDNEKFKSETKCDCCGSKGIAGVGSSSLGAISHAICMTCITENAEPLVMFLFTYEMTNDGADVAEWVKDGLKTFHDGEYISWSEFVGRVSTGRIKYEPIG